MHKLEVTYAKPTEILWGMAINGICNPSVKTVINAQKAAEQSVQLTAFGASLRARLGNYLIRLGCRLAKVGGN